MDGAVPSLDDLVAGLWKGEKKIEVPKSKITEPLQGWKSSKYALPEPGSKGSMRKGRLHAHDHGDSYEVHLDHYDPDTNPVLHLVVDAPVLIFLTHFLQAAAKGAGEQLRAAAEEGLVAKYRTRRAWATRLALGLALAALAGLMFIDPEVSLYTAEALLTLAILGFGALMIYSSFKERGRAPSKMHALAGCILLLLGIVSAMRPDIVFALFLIFLAVWMLITAYYIFKDRRRGEGLEGTGSLVLGFASLSLGVMTFVDINVGALFFLYFIAAIIMAFGISQVYFAFKARSMASSPE
jgi:uncharacterized membrane protein HdeD (DUF308 family)